jgi:Protein of unknown function (DUF1569)
MQNNNFLDFTNQPDILKRLAKLTVNTKPSFGILTPQLMIEHLAINIQFSNGKNPLSSNGRNETSPMKSFLLSNQPMPTGTTFFLIGKKLADPINKDLDEAIEFLLSEMSDYEDYYKQNSSEKPFHAVFGNLNKSEWTIYHNKHFTHHFNQFDI